MHHQNGTGGVNPHEPSLSSRCQQLKFLPLANSRRHLQRPPRLPAFARNQAAENWHIEDHEPLAHARSCSISPPLRERHMILRRCGLFEKGSGASIHDSDSSIDGPLRRETGAYLLPLASRCCPAANVNISWQPSAKLKITFYHRHRSSHYWPTCRGPIPSQCIAPPISPYVAPQMGFAPPTKNGCAMAKSRWQIDGVSWRILRMRSKTSTVCFFTALFPPKSLSPALKQSMLQIISGRATPIIETASHAKPFRTSPLWRPIIFRKPNRHYSLNRTGDTASLTTDSVQTKAPAAVHTLAAQPGCPSWRSTVCEIDVRHHHLYCQSARTLAVMAAQTPQSAGERANGASSL
ncbi:hypothetical protein BU26DRAFT_149787 [Trematosphaeria pertusa]|uniref:Uncharacterized protein n=1 Tax=Trematosphaeria pertusa TaxID=390896 RepID=A0A6A6IXJ3_9PLEO|nr:uncharacterized protein BU26DRAFT_149787 [Trematosphaeria pertusa]KAF2255028.1 hypothetical protein BU26DRAFT_149787 [Trematosphaeria pertusa]